MEKGRGKVRCGGGATLCIAKAQDFFFFNSYPISELSEVSMTRSYKLEATLKFVDSFAGVSWSIMVSFIPHGTYNAAGISFQNNMNSL